MINNFINAATYEDICDFAIIPDEGKLFLQEYINKNAIIFCKTDYIGYLFNCISNSDYKYNIITHHSDYSIDENVYSYTPKSVNKWFAINAVINKSNLIKIPLGIKTHKGIYKENHYDIPWFVENINFLKNKNKILDTVYCNWSNTNSYRNSIINNLKVKYKLETGFSFKEYCNNMSDYKFVLSPPGNGIDCHRTWECLYMGCIPVVIKHKIYDNWIELPILQVNNYSELNEELLNEFLQKEFNYNKLYLNYWKEKIKNI